MQITVPSTIDNTPQVVVLNGVSYTLGPGETITVPDAVANELYRMIAAETDVPPAVPLPFEDAELKKEVQGLDTRLTAVEAEFPIPAELPEYPESDGTYTLQVVMASGEATLSWETVPADDQQPQEGF